MTELYIDGVLAVLPQSLNIQIKRENPLFTKNGEYTYDVTLSLTNSINANLYKNIHRMNSVYDVPSKRRAVLVADNRVFCNGTEVVTGWTDTTVTIQIVSGNSELNFLVGGDKEIASLTSMPDIDYSSTAFANIDKAYPDVQVCFPPVYDKVNSMVANKWLAVRDTTPLPDTFYSNPQYAQPFLCAYIEQLFKALGYKLGYNQIAESNYKNVYIAQVAHATNWAQMLPGWTIIEFLEQIEHLFNGTFLIDDKTKSVSFLFRSDFYKDAEIAHIRDIQDAYTVEIDEEPEIEDMADSNISYKLESTEFWRWYRLPDKVLEVARRKTIPTNYTTGDAFFDSFPLFRLRDWFRMTQNQRTDTIFYDEKYKLDVIYNPDCDSLCRIVNRFADLFDEDRKTDFELEVVPATYEKVDIDVRNNDGSSLVVGMFVPAISSAPSRKESSESLIDMIKTGGGGEKPSKSTISLAIYSGLMNIAVNEIFSPSVPLSSYPYPYIDEWYLFERYSNGKVNDSSLLNAAATLRLHEMGRLFYQRSYDIDFKRKIEITSYDVNNLDTRCLFEINNLYYVCFDITYNLTIDGRSRGWTGTFYPIHFLK